MKRIYRISGVSFRQVGPKICCVIELQHRQTGALYYHHKDFPLLGRFAAFMVGWKIFRIINAEEVPADWEQFLPEELIGMVHSPS